MPKDSANKYIRLLKNIGMLLAGNFVTKILSFFMVPFYTSILTTSDYGTADLINNTVLLVLPLFSLLMDEAVMRFTLDRTTDRKQIFTIAMTISTIGFLGALCISPLVLLSETIRPYYIFVVMYYVISWLYNITASYVKGLDKLSVVTIAGLIHTLVYIGLNIFFLVIVKIGIYGYLLAINLSNLIVIIYFTVVCKIYKNFISIKLIDRNLCKRMIRYSIPLIPNSMSWWINNASDKYILSFFCGTTENGIYSIAYKIPSLLNSVTRIFFSAWKISSVDNFGSRESIEFYNHIYAFYCSVLTTIGAVLIVIIKPLATILYANDFFVAWRITPILVLAYIFSSLALQIESVFSASKQTKQVFYASVLGAAKNFTLNLLFIPKFGGTGAAIATVIGYAIIWFVNMINSRKIIKMDLNLGRIIPSIMFIIIEIWAIRLDNHFGHIVATFCLVSVLVINLQEFIKIISVIMKKFFYDKI